MNLNITIFLTFKELFSSLIVTQILESKSANVMYVSYEYWE